MSLSPNFADQAQSPGIVPDNAQSSPLTTHDACLEKTFPTAPKKRKYHTRYEFYTQAGDMQGVIAEAVKANGLNPGQLSSLCRVWLDLETYRRSVRFPGAKSPDPVPAPGPAPGPPAESFTEEP